MALTFRQLIPFLGPSWFTKDKVTNPDGSQTETDSRVLYSLMVMLDAMTARITAGVTASFIGLGPDDAQAMIGQDRQCLRGPAESAVAYAVRLQTVIDDARLSGNAWSLLSQIRGYCAPNPVRVRLYNDHGNCYTIDRSGARSVVRHTIWNWDGLGVGTGSNALPSPGTVGVTQWSRFWVVIYPATGGSPQPWQRSSTWGTAGQVWGPANTKTTWGSTATADDVFAIQRIVRTWKPFGSRCSKIIVCFDDTALDPNVGPLPNGTWGNDGKYVGGVMVAARNTNCLYWTGTSGN